MSPYEVMVQQLVSLTLDAFLHPATPLDHAWRQTDHDTRQSMIEEAQDAVRQHLEHSRGICIEEWNR